MTQKRFSHTARTMLLLVAVLLPMAVSAQLSRISLNSTDGAEWQIAPRAEVPDSGAAIATAGYSLSNAVKGVVPGVVFTAYVEAGKEKCPEYGDNIYQVDETLYNRPFWYRTEFLTPENLKSGQRLWLHVDNTNRYADYYFNGTKISGSPTSAKDISGHMLRAKFDITKLVKRNGEKNALAILVYDADQKKTRTDKGPYGVACSPSYLAGAGWDWMPYVPGRLSGVTGNVWLSVSADAVMQDPWIRSKLICDNKAAELSFTTEVRNNASVRKQITVSGVIEPSNIKFSKTVVVEAGQTVHVNIGKQDVPELVMENPRLWWPNGYGDPNLYTCRLTCMSDGAVSDQRTISFGIRQYDYRIEHNAVGYPVLTLYVNGQRVFVKGGNWGMSEYMLRCHGQQYEPKIRLHHEMNYNMIRLWTGCVTDEEFYDYCDRYGIMVWDDFWLYVAWNDVAEHDAFKTNARDKVRRLRNHACIAVWCGANETHPVPDIDEALRMIVMEEDGNDRLYKSCSNQDALTGSGWWKNMPPRHHFETSASNLAFNKPSYPYGIDHGYGFRSEIGMGTFPTFESTKLFIPKKDWWPLPTDQQLKDDDSTVWNRHFFGKEASNGGPVDYKQSVNERFGESKSLEEFCEKAQLLNIEDMRGMYEAWNDKMWNDASGILIWMSHPAYPSFVWQTYDYYYDPTGAYWGAKWACEPRHIQWNCLTNSVKVVNAASQALNGVVAEACVYDISGKEVQGLRKTVKVSVGESNVAEAFVMDFGGVAQTSPLHFLRLRLKDSQGRVMSENFYWRNGKKELDYTSLAALPQAKVTVTAQRSASNPGLISIRMKNTTDRVAFANRLRLTDKKTGERILPAYWSNNYVTLMPHEERTLTVEVEQSLISHGAKLLLKPYGEKETLAATVK